jgi:oligopeptide/dipeptide ABC transporter ATP-binding protein
MHQANISRPIADSLTTSPSSIASPGLSRVPLSTGERAQVSGLVSAGEATEPLVHVDSLRIHFPPRRTPIRVVEGVSYSVARGETLGIVGESGSGKTLSSLAILRLLPRPAQIAGGRIVFEGEDLAAKSDEEMRRLRGKRIAMVFQNPGFSLHPLMTIGGQLSEILVVHESLARKDAAARVEELLRLVGISDPGTRIGQYPHELSGGMKQRVCIARALLCNPSLVLADEPTTSLDVTIQAQILELFEELKARFRMSMIFVTHDMGVVARIADRIAVMYAGQICETANASTIFSNPQHPYTRALLGSTPRVDQRSTRASGFRLPTIGGSGPTIMQQGDGCRFADRCAEASPECARLAPLPLAVGPGHIVQCLKRGSAGEANHA